MKRIIHLVFVAAVVSGAGLARTQDSDGFFVEAPMESEEIHLNVAAMGRSAERHAAPEAQPIRKVESMVEGTGLVRYGASPRGGPNEDWPF